MELDSDFDDVPLSELKNIVSRKEQERKQKVEKKTSKNVPSRKLIVQDDDDDDMSLADLKMKFKKDPLTPQSQDKKDDIALAKLAQNLNTSKKQSKPALQPKPKK